MNRDLVRQSVLRHARLTFARSGGPGGQNVNKVSTKVRAAVALDAIEGISEEERGLLRKRLAARLDREGRLFVDVDQERSQERNRAIALERLEERIAAALRTRRRRVRTKPTMASRERRLRLKRLRSQAKRDRSWRG